MRKELEGGFELDDDRARVDVDAVHRFLSTEAYWAIGRPRETVERLVRESTRVLGLYSPDGRQAGFCRVVTDGNSIAYLADVYIHPDFRGRGLGAALVREAVVEGPHANVRWVLHTNDPAFYEPFGFGPPPERLMERPRPGAPPGMP
ncbi:MAG TPA: GNAT family N-acetyltransferase [Thermoleophilaceae bacterium]